MVNAKPLIIVALGIAVAFSIGIIIGNFAIKKTDKSSTSTTENYYEDLIREVDNKLTLELLEKELDATKIRDHLKYLTSIPHMAGTPGDKLSADYVYNQWKSQGLDNIHMIDYDVLLDFPDDIKFNNVEVLNSASVLEKKYEINEPTYDKELNYSAIPKPFLAYAKSGSIESSELYYVNYCVEEDFILLEKQGVKLNSNSIVICRYGQVFRGNKVQLAEIYGAGGVLLYDDPKKSAPKVSQDSIYPKGQFLPGEGTQRGSLYVKNGDLYTPNFPATDYAYRNKSYESDLPKIPAQVIGYNVAYELFKLIESNGNQVVNEWKGDFNLTYTYGGKLKDNRKLRLNVFNQRRVEKTYNVLGVIRGLVEPDRYVIIGNHRDAWSFGALDPTSGTSVILEISRALINLKRNKNWRPRRSIIFSSWGAEEYGLIGSFENVEEYIKKLQANTVAYFNLDTIIYGTYSYEAAASPLLYDHIFEVCKSIKLPTGETVFDRWLENQPNSDGKEPDISPYLGAGSDHASFSQIVGAPCVDQSYVRKRNDPLFPDWGTRGYPTYHSSYETFNLVSTYLDPKFETFRTIGLITGELIRRTADSLILPFNVTRYAQVLKSEYEQFKLRNQNDFNQLNIPLFFLERALNDLDKEATLFTERLKSVNKTEYHLIRMYNEQFRSFERAFLNSQIGAKRSNYEHLVFAPSLYNSYGSDFLPSIEDALYNYKKNPESREFKEQIKFQLSVVTYAMHSAISILKQPYDFSR